jgi:uncharacterized membrane protein
MFGLWALLDRRDWKWVTTPILLGAIYFLLVTRVAMPYFRQGEPWHVAKQFEHLGNGPLGIIQNMFCQPSLLWRHLLGHDNVQYVIFLVQPLGWLLPIVNPAAVIALPDLAANTLSNNSALKVIAWHYNLTTTSALFVSLVLTLQRLRTWLQRRGNSADCIQICGVVFIALAQAPWFLWFQPRVLARLPQHQSLLRAMERVPPDRSVVAPQRTLAHLAQREHYSDLAIFTVWPRYASQFEYVILDANENQYPPFITQEFFEQFYRNPLYQLIFAENNVFVFQRNGPPVDWQFGR